MADRPMPPARNAADPKQVRQAKRSAGDHEKAVEAAYRELMGTPAGRMAMWDQLERHGLYKTVFDPHGSWMAFNAGKHSMGLELQALLVRVAPKEYLRMEEEARLRQARNDEELEAFLTTRADERKAERDGE